ncbi:hypothetical protein GSB9_02830 [Flavobacteriaceae bacterium GSB9]|nr:hypothetical protein GSB9_02830 [Flavobacteriaceae bacterium GSB9]
MKTFNKIFKKVALVAAIFCVLCSGAQKKFIDFDTFVRVYNLSGKKIAKGQMAFLNDSIIGIKSRDKIKKINFLEIGKIKTKRSGGHNVLMGSVMGASLGIVAGISTADPDAWIFGYSASEGAAGFGILGALGGGALGGIVAGLKNSETLFINGNAANWKAFKNSVEIKNQ